MKITKLLPVLFCLFCTTVLLSCSNDKEEDDRTTCISSASSTIFIKINNKDGSPFDYNQLLVSKGIKSIGNISKSSLPIRLNDRNDKTYFTMQTDEPHLPTIIDNGTPNSETYYSSAASLQLSKQHFDLVFTYRFVIRESSKNLYEPFYQVSNLFIETVTFRGEKIGIGSSTNIPTITFQEQNNGEFDIIILE